MENLQINKIASMNNKKGQVNMVQGMIGIILGIIITVILGFVIVNIFTDSNLLQSGSAESNATDRLVANFTSGIDEVSSKVPTFLLVTAFVLIIGVLAVLVAIARKSGFLGGGGNTL